MMTLPINEIVSLTAGIRKAWQDTALVDLFRFFPGDELTDNQTASTLGITIVPDDAWRFFAKYEDVCRFPLIDEEASVFGTPTTLETQTGESFEIGSTWDHLWGQSKITAYKLDLENEISFDSTTFQNVNLDPTDRKGLIYELNLYPLDKLSVDMQYTYTSAEFSEGTFADNKVPMVAEHQFHLGSTYEIFDDLNIHGDIFLISDRVAGNDFADVFPDLPGYGAGNINLTYDNEIYFVSMQINNIMDKEYSDSASVGANAFFINEVGFFTSPERNFTLSIGYTFN